MSTPQLTLLLAIHDLEEARTMRYRSSTVLQYYCNESLNSSSLITALDAIVQKVSIKFQNIIDIQISSTFLRQLSRLTVTHSLPPMVADEVCKILIACTHRFRKVREAALTYARTIIETFPSFLCDRKVVFTLLEILTLMRRSCELQYTDEVRKSFPSVDVMTDVSIRQYTSSTPIRWT